MAIGSAIERGSMIVVFDERGMTLFSKAGGQDLRTDCWEPLVPPSPHGSVQSSTRTTRRV